MTWQEYTDRRATRYLQCCSFAQLASLAAIITPESQPTPLLNLRSLPRFIADTLQESDSPVCNVLDLSDSLDRDRFGQYLLAEYRRWTFGKRTTNLEVKFVDGAAATAYE